MSGLRIFKHNAIRIKFERLNYCQILIENGKTEKEALYILSKRSRDNARTPMQWSAQKFAGFSEKEPWIPIAKNYKEINAKQECADKSSILYFYRQLIQIRKEKKVIAEGKIEFLYEKQEDVFAYKRYLEENPEKEIVVLNNLSEKEISLKANIPLENYKRLLGNYQDWDLKGSEIRLRPYETIILEKSNTV